MSTEADVIPVKNDLKGWIVFVILAFVWGGSFILIKKGLIHFTPLEVGAIRISVSAVAFMLIFENKHW